MTTTRCDWSDLPTHTCGHCTGSPDLHKMPRLHQLAIDTPAPAHVAWTPAADSHQPTPRDWDDGRRTPRPISPCHYDPDHGHLLRSHLPDCTNTGCGGCQPCTHTPDGTPVRHCGGTAGCNSHLEPGTHVCPRCLNRVRNDLDHIEHIATLLLDEAIHDGITSEAATQEGPTAHPDDRERYLRTLSGLRGCRLADEQDHRGPDHHLYVLRRLERLLRRRYGHDDTNPHGQATRTLAYLAWMLTDLAHDPNTATFRRVYADVTTVHAHLESVMRAQRGLDRGAPCPACADPKPRLRRHFAHWCTDPDCTREHDRTGARDTWICPRNRDHWWREADYRRVTYEDAVAAGMKPRRKGARI